jgi:hypothetical protein
MSVTSLSCPRCGSDDVEEVSGSNYKCKSCRSRFVWADPNVTKIQQDMLVCSCGSQAIGKCKLCGQLICPSHSKYLSYVIPAESRHYFYDSVYPLLSVKTKFDDLLCENCFSKEAHRLMGKVDQLKASGKVCLADGCFSVDLVSCEICGYSSFCNTHTPIRKAFRMSRNPFGSKKSNPVGYQKVCPKCFSEANSNLENVKVFWK